jgi:hypothetical protein
MLKNMFKECLEQRNIFRFALKICTKYDEGLFGAGKPRTAEQESQVELWLDKPNISRWLLYFTEDPQRISDYMAANCSTATVGGDRLIDTLQTDEFGRFLGDAFNVLLLWC